MSFITPGTVQAIAHSLDIPLLSDEAAKALAPDVEYKLREVIQVRCYGAEGRRLDCAVVRAARRWSPLARVLSAVTPEHLHQLRSMAPPQCRQQLHGQGRGTQPSNGVSRRRRPPLAGGPEVCKALEARQAHH